MTTRLYLALAVIGIVGSEVAANPLEK